MTFSLLRIYLSGYDEALNISEEFTCIQVIEISRGSKVKYELDKKSGLIKVSFETLLKKESFSNLRDLDC